MAARAQGTVVADVSTGSAAARVGIRRGDRVLSVNGVQPRDIIEWHQLVAEDSVELRLSRKGEELSARLETGGEPLGLSIESALFDRVHTCDNHCDFCFIYQLPKGLRRSLYLKDDDYRLSFLFGNFTTLTRFTEADVERVVAERLSPLHVSVHTTDPTRRSRMLRNDRGGMSLRWMRVLMENGIDVKAQIVLCPGVNDGSVLDETLATLIESSPDLQAIAIVPLGLSAFNPETHLRVLTDSESSRLVTQVEQWQARFRRVLGRQPLFLSDEVYLNAGHPLPDAEHYGGYPMIEDGIGVVRSFVDSFQGRGPAINGRADGFFTAFDAPNPTEYTSAGNPAGETGFRRPTNEGASNGALTTASRTVVLTGRYAAPVLRSLVSDAGFESVEVREIPNRFFGGNTGVAGLMTFSDIFDHVRDEPADTVFVLPDVCLNEGRFLDGPTIDDLRRVCRVVVVPTSGSSLRGFLERQACLS